MCENETVRHDQMTQVTAASFFMIGGHVHMRSTTVNSLQNISNVCEVSDSWSVTQDDDTRLHCIHGDKSVCVCF